MLQLNLIEITHSIIYPFNFYLTKLNKLNKTKFINLNNIKIIYKYCRYDTALGFFCAIYLIKLSPLELHILINPSSEVEASRPGISGDIEIEVQALS